MKPLAFVFATTVCAAFAVGWSTARSAAAEDGFVPLFPQRSLDGWTGATEGWEFQDDRLVCSAKGGQIRSTKNYGNFVFRFDYKLQPGGNNGVDVRGMEIQILDDGAPKHANLKPCQYHGSIYCHVPAERGHQKPPGQWNCQEILVDGNHVKVTLNGAVILDAHTDHNALKKPAGYLGFKGHHEHVEFRNLQVKELP